MIQKHQNVYIYLKQERILLPIFLQAYHPTEELKKVCVIKDAHLKYCSPTSAHHFLIQLLKSWHHNSQKMHHTLNTSLTRAVGRPTQVVSALISWPVSICGLLSSCYSHYLFTSGLRWFRKIDKFIYFFFNPFVHILLQISLLFRLHSLPTLSFFLLSYH